MATLTRDVLDDEIAVSIACAIATANQRAREAGVDVSDSLITISQRDANGHSIWRVNYGPKDYIGKRGGDLIVEIDSTDGSFKQMLRGQ